MAQNTVVYGIYKSTPAAEAAIEHMRSEGFQRENISVLFPETSSNKNFVLRNSTKATEDSISGAASAAGGTVGGLLGGLIGLGLPENEARRYQGHIRDSGILLSVHCENMEWTDRAESLLHRTGANQIVSAGEAPDSDQSDRPRSKGTFSRIGVRLR